MAADWSSILTIEKLSIVCDRCAFSLRRFDGIDSIVHIAACRVQQFMQPVFASFRMIAWSDL